MTRSFEFGVELLHPPNYEVKVWEIRSSNMPNTLNLWRDGRPGRKVELQLFPADSMLPFSAHTHARTTRCTIRTQSGDASALLEKVATTTLPSEPDSFYVILVRLPRADGVTALSFSGSSIDSAGHVEHIAIAQTLRLREMRAREPGPPRIPASGSPGRETPAF